MSAWERRNGWILSFGTPLKNALSSNIAWLSNCHNICGDGCGVYYLDWSCPTAIASFFFKFFLWVSHQLDGGKGLKGSVPLSHLSAIQPFHRPSVIGTQDYEITKHGTAVGSPEVHLSAKLQVSGEAEYADDTPLPPNGLHAALVLSLDKAGQGVVRALTSRLCLDKASLPGFVLPLISPMYLEAMEEGLLALSRSKSSIDGASVVLNAVWD